MKHTRKAALSFCIFFTGLLLSACGIKTEDLSEPYSFEDRPFILDDLSDPGEGYGTLFASDLCVVEDESLYPADMTNSEAAALFDLSDGEVIYSKNAYEKLYPASITKIMTCLLAVKYGNLDDEVTVTSDAVITEYGATLAGVNPGDVLTLEQLLYALMIPSGNDAAAAIAVHMGGSIEGFADMMNEEARQLGATNTHFVNPHGLTNEDHYTTAYDLYLIYNECLKYDKFREVTATTNYTATYRNAAGEPVTKTWDGANWYMVGQWETPAGLKVFSGKTGTTQAAGYCLIIGSRDTEDNEYISVVLKAPSRNELYENMTRMLREIVE